MNKVLKYEETLINRNLLSYILIIVIILQYYNNCIVINPIIKEDLCIYEENIEKFKDCNIESKNNIDNRKVIYGLKDNNNKVTKQELQLEKRKKTYEYLLSSEFKEEYEYFVKLIYCEAGGESFEGQVAVANVVLNRLTNWEMESVTEVINQEGQFEPVATGKINEIVPTESVYKAIDHAINNIDNTNGAVFFCASNYVKDKENLDWYNSLNCTAVIGAQTFYK